MMSNGARYLRRGELVEVRGKDEILTTLDENGELEGLVFMPEMLEFCGRRLRVSRRAHKTCDTITGDMVARRLDDCVHLEDARCDGSAHGGCQAGCLFFWKEAWVKRVEPARPSLMWRAVAGSSESSHSKGPSGAPCTEDALLQMAVQQDPSSSEEPTYRCQVTRLLDATAPLPWWEPMQYMRDWLSGNVPLFVLLRGLFFRVLYRVVRVGIRLGLRSFWIKIYNGVARFFGEVVYPYAPGQVPGKTPSRKLDLQPGELVRVRPLEEILQTVNAQRRNRGMGFAPEMVRYCGGTFRVRSRVKSIIDEPTGKMMHFGNECIILEDVICRSECSGNRMFCPRSIYPYWREIWLERVDEGHDAGGGFENSA
jgi:hypothetical protein